MLAKQQTGLADWNDERIDPPPVVASADGIV